MKKTARKKRPIFIAIEGGEGSGKSSLVMALKEKFGDKIFFTREPGGSAYAETIREAAIKDPLAKFAPPLTTLCLMFAARFDNIANAILPTLKRQMPVIADRFDASSYAYQVAAQSSDDLEDVFWTLRGKLDIVPDLYVFLDVDPREGLRRAAARNQSLLAGYDNFDDREIAFHKKVRKGYLEFFKKVPHKIIDANQPFEKVKADFLTLIEEKIKV
ncbi:MAG: dTMP kinase [Patescibacteria group bacterium]|nr:dTMP kinase [Patescibacteria group bacterium]